MNKISKFYQALLGRGGGYGDKHSGERVRDGAK